MRSERRIVLEKPCGRSDALPRRGNDENRSIVVFSDKKWTGLVVPEPYDDIIHHDRTKTAGRQIGNAAIFRYRAVISFFRDP